MAEEYSSSFEWPPLDWGGGATYSVTSSRGAGEKQRALRQTVTQTLEGASYIYAPWLVGVSGNVNVTKSVGRGQSSSEDALTLTGGMTVSVLPRSLYPVEISYNRFDSSVAFDGDLSEISGQVLKVQSRILSFDRTAISTALTMSDTRSDDGFQENYKEADVSMTRSFDKDDMNVRLSYRDREFSRPDGTSETGRAVNANWRYRSAPFVDVNTDSVTTVRYATLVSPSYDERNVAIQGVSTAMWRPKELPELSVHGAVRTYSLNGSAVNLETGNRMSSSYQTAFTDLSASYLFAPRLVGNFGIDAGYESQKQEQSQSFNLSNSAMRYGTRANLGYSSVSHPLLGFDWNWSTSTSVGARYGSAGLEHSESISLAHSARRMLELPFLDEPFSLSFSQSGSVGYSDLDAALSVGHAVSLGRSTREGKNWDYIQASVTDNRAFGTAATEGQLMHFQFTRGYDPDRFSSLSGSISYQIARFSSARGEAVHSDSIGGSVTFRQINVFGVERLNFTSDLSLQPPSLFRSERSYYSSFAAREEDVGFGTQRWTNRLDYTIGKLRTSLIARVINTPEGLGESILFQVTRAF